MTRHFLADADLNPQEQADVLNLALNFATNRHLHQPFAGPQGVAIIFDKPSTRTRVSFSVGVAELGGYPLIIDSSGSQMGRGEPISDTAQVLTRQVSAIVWRTFSQAGLEEMAHHSRVPVINALTDDYHPCQILADLMTVAQHRGELKRCLVKHSPIWAMARTTWHTPTSLGAPLRGCMCVSLHLKSFIPAQKLLLKLFTSRPAPADQ